MLRIIHKIAIDEIKNTNHIFDNKDYMGIIFTMETEIFDNFIGAFIKAKLPYGYDKIQTSIKMGILNANNIFCNKYTFDYIFDHNINEAVGSQSFIDKTKLNKYNINGDIFIGYEILKCDYETNQARMIQKIYQYTYENFHQKEIDLLKYQNNNLNKLNLIIKEQDKDINNKNIKFKNQFHNLEFQHNELKKDLILKNKFIENLQESISMLNIENDELKCEIKYYSPNTNINDYIQVTKKSDCDNEESIQQINIYGNKTDDKYMINILDLDQVNLNNFSVYDLKVMQNKLKKLDTIIDDKILELEACQICYTNECNCILLPCGHKCCCSDCSKNIKRKCPMCRKYIENICKIF